MSHHMPVCQPRMSISSSEYSRSDNLLFFPGTSSHSNRQLAAIRRYASRLPDTDPPDSEAPRDGTSSRRPPSPTGEEDLEQFSGRPSSRLNRLPSSPRLMSPAPANKRQRLDTDNDPDGASEPSDPEENGNNIFCPLEQDGPSDSEHDGK